jgi:hypothetical protein
MVLGMASRVELRNDASSFMIRLRTAGCGRGEPMSEVDRELDLESNVHLESAGPDEILGDADGEADSAEAADAEVE